MVTGFALRFSILVFLYFRAFLMITSLHCCAAGPQPPKALQMPHTASAKPPVTGIYFLKQKAYRLSASGLFTARFGVIFSVILTRTGPVSIGLRFSFYWGWLRWLFRSHILIRDIRPLSDGNIAFILRAYYFISGIYAMTRWITFSYFRQVSDIDMNIRSFGAHSRLFSIDILFVFRLF